MVNCGNYIVVINIEKQIISRNKKEKEKEN